MIDTPATDTPILDNTLISRNPDLVTSPVLDETMMMDVKNGHFYGLDDIGSVIWQRLEQPSKFGEIVDRLAAEYDAERELIASEVGQLLTTMAQYKVVTLT